MQRLTEGRVPVFSHEVVPDHLRTKPDPEVEELEKQLSADASRLTPEVAQVRAMLAASITLTGPPALCTNVSSSSQKQVQTMNKLCNNLLDKIIKEERESDVGSECARSIDGYSRV